MLSVSLEIDVIEEILDCLFHVTVGMAWIAFLIFVFWGAPMLIIWWMLPRSIPW